MQHAILGTFLVINDELHGGARAARPIGIRWLLAIAAQVSRIICHCSSSSDSIPLIDDLPFFVGHGRQISNRHDACHYGLQMNSCGLGKYLLVIVEHDAEWARPEKPGAPVPTNDNSRSVR